MQRLAAYRLESPMFGSSTDTAIRSTAVRDLVEEWLRTKGVADDGSYIARDQSAATYRTLSETYNGESWEFVELVEVTDYGRRFVADLSVAVTHDRVLVYATLEVGSASSQVNVVPVDARCPSIVRSLLQEAGPWFHGPSELHVRQPVSGFDNGETLAAQLLDPERRVPVVAISSGGPPTLDSLGKQVGHDLAGLANVVNVDTHASWALTDALGLAFTCHSGAVRIYWPGLTPESSPYRHPLWTARRIIGPNAGSVTTEPLRRQLRRIVMSASAVSVLRPEAIDRIRQGASIDKFEELRTSAASVEEWRKLAELYADANEDLRNEARALDTQVTDLSARLRTAVSDTAALRYQLRSLGHTVNVGVEEMEPDFEDPSANPVSGEVRFYKKVYSTPSHDVLTRTADCGHNKWQNAPKADKAKKGIAKLESSDAWTTLQHCGTCTGGGAWRVKW